MGDHLVAIAMPERRSKSRGVIEQFNTLHIDTVPEEYRPILDILQTYFSVRDAQPLDRMPSDQRHRVVEAILQRIQNEREGLERRQIAGTESLATNAFLVNRLYSLKEVVAALLGGGLIPEDIDGMLARGESIVCRSMASLEIRRPIEIAPLFSALQYILTGPSGEAAWAAATDVSNVPLSSLVCGIGGTPPSLTIDTRLTSLLNLYWAVVLRGDVRRPSDLRTIPDFAARIAPSLLRAIQFIETAAGFRPVYDLVAPPFRDKPTVYTLQNALRLYTTNPTNLSALLQYLSANTQAEADAAAGARIGSLDICRICGATAPARPILNPTKVRLAAAYAVALTLRDLLGI